MENRREFMRSTLTALSVAPVAAMVPAVLANEVECKTEVFHVVFCDRANYRPINVSIIPSGEFSCFIAPSGKEVAVQLTQLSNNQINIELFDVTETTKARLITRSTTSRNSYTSWSSLGLGMHILPKDSDC
jgi:hypothetical protein